MKGVDSSVAMGGDSTGSSSSSSLAVGGGPSGSSSSSSVAVRLSSSLREAGESSVDESYVGRKLKHLNS